MATVLVLEDGVLDATVIRFLEGAGHEVRAAGGVTNARKILDEDDVELMLTSMASRGRSRVEFIEAVRAHWPAIAVVLVTDEATAREGAELAARGVVAEAMRMPVTLVQIRDGVRRGLTGRDLLTPIEDLRWNLQRLASTELADDSREIVRQIARDVEVLASRARSVTGGR